MSKRRRICFCFSASLALTSAPMGTSNASQRTWDFVSLSTAVRQQRDNSFYPRDAMLVRILAMTLCLCLSVSVTSGCSIKTV